MRLRAPFRPRYRTARTGAVCDACGCVEHIPHLLGIVLPIGGEVQAPAGRELAHQQRGERGLDQPALVVPLLVPWIREVDADLVEAGVGGLVVEHLDRVVVVDPHVGGVVGGQCVEQAADAGGVHLDTDQVARLVVLRGEAQRLAVAEPDLQHARRTAAEDRVVIARLALVVDAVARPLLVERALLRRGEPALAQHEAAHLAVALGDSERLGRSGPAGRVFAVAHQPIKPSTGLDALAKRLRGMRPARKAARPASTASFIACAIRTGSFAPAIAVFISTPSQPSSIAMAASEAVPTPASTMIGTLAFSTISIRFHLFWMPSPEPIGAASGITATQPISSSRLASSGSSEV